jgi:transposase InsO family protein
MGEGRRLPALTGATDYNYWSGLLRAQLLIDKTWGLVQGTVKRPTDLRPKESEDQLQDRQAEWDDMNNNAMGRILKHLSEGPMNMVQDKETAYEMWEELRKTYQLKGYSARHVIWNRLMRSELKQFSSISEFGESMKKGMIELNNLAEASYQEWQITSTFLHGLGPEWDPIVNSIIYSTQERARSAQSPETEPSFHDVFQQVLDFERRQNAGEDKKALTVQATRTKDGKKTCTHCSKKNHTKENCFFLHPEKAPASWKKREDRDAKALQTKPVALTAQRKDDTWYMDSGAWYHMSWDRTQFRTYRATKQSIQVADGRIQECQGIGTIVLSVKDDKGKTDDVTVKDVLYVPSLQNNLLSLGSIEAQGNEISLKGGRCIVTRTRDRVVLATGSRTKNGRLYRLNGKPVQHGKALTATVTKAADLCTWHRRLGHLGFDAIRQLPLQATGIRIRDEDLASTVCESCIQGKQHRNPCRDPMTRASVKLGLVHIDIGGGGHITPSVGGARYYMIVTDDLTRYRWVYFLKYKSEALSRLKDFAIETENQKGIKTKRIRSDGGGEFDSKDAHEWAKKNGIQWEYTAPYAPDQNGVSERSMRTIMSKTRTALLDAKMDEALWAEAMNTVVYLTNRSPNKSTTNNMTPYEAWYGDKPSLGHLRAFGCTAYVHIPTHKGKLDPRSWKGQLIGYVSDSIYKIWNPKNRDVHRARDVSFIEEQRPIQADNLEGQEQEAEELGATELTPRRSRAQNERLDDDTQESREPSPAPSTLSHITVQGAEPEHQTSCQPEPESEPAEESATEPAEGSATELASEPESADDDQPPLED